MRWSIKFCRCNRPFPSSLAGMVTTCTTKRRKYEAPSFSTTYYFPSVKREILKDLPHGLVQHLIDPTKADVHGDGLFPSGSRQRPEIHQGNQENQQTGWDVTTPSRFRPTLFDLSLVEAEGSCCQRSNRRFSYLH